MQGLLSEEQYLGARKGPGYLVFRQHTFLNGAFQCTPKQPKIIGCMNILITSMWKQLEEIVHM